jgi:CHAD domain-containing protein
MNRSAEHSSRVGKRTEVDALGHLADSLHRNSRRYFKRHKRCRNEITIRTVHRSRVQTRRLFSQLELLKGFVPAKELKEARHSLKRHHKLFRDVRDAHVQIARVEEMRGGLPVAVAFGAWLCKRGARASRKASGAIERVKTKRLKGRIASFEEELRRRSNGASPKQDRQKLRSAITRAFERVVQRDRDVDAADPKTIHRVRVALKHYYYIAEALPVAISHMTKERRKGMRECMSRMGKIQDLEVMIGALQAFEQKKETVDGSVCELREILWRRRAELIQGFVATGRNFSSFRPTQ